MAWKNCFHLWVGKSIINSKLGPLSNVWEWGFCMKTQREVSKHWKMPMSYTAYYHPIVTVNFRIFLKWTSFDNKKFNVIILTNNLVKSAK